MNSECAPSAAGMHVSTCPLLMLARSKLLASLSEERAHFAYGVYGSPRTEGKYLFYGLRLRVLQSHYSYHVTEGEYLVCDIQGTPNTACVSHTIQQKTDDIKRFQKGIKEARQVSAGG